MGGLLPIKLKNYYGWSSVLPDNSSFLFFFEKNEIKKCIKKMVWQLCIQIQVIVS